MKVVDFAEDPKYKRTKITSEAVWMAVCLIAGSTTQTQILMAVRIVRMALPQITSVMWIISFSSTAVGRVRMQTANYIKLMMKIHSPLEECF